MRHWKESLVSAVLVILMLSLFPVAAADYNWNTGYDYWSDAANWTPAGGPPGASDRAFIGTLTTNPTVYLTQGASASYLSLQNGAWLRTSGYTMQVWGDTYLNKTTSSSVQLFVNSGVIGDDDFDTDLLSIIGGAELDMEGGVAEIDDQIIVDPNSYITGYGTINFRTNHEQALNLKGTLSTDTGTLTLKVIGGYTGKIDLDGLGTGAGNSIINITSGTSSLVVDGPVSDAFDGTMTIGEGNSVNFTQPWTHSGTLNFNAGSGTATLSGGTVTVNQAINVNSGTGHITADVVFNPGTAVAVAGGATLRLYGQTTYQGSSYTGAGTLAQYGDATIATNTTIGTTIYDWDGTGGSETTVNSGITFTIDSDKIDLSTPSADGFDGTVNVNGGTLTVNTTAPWRMEGTMNLNYDSAYGELYGSEMIVASTGTLNTGNSNVYAPITVEGTVNAAYGRFHGTTVFESTANVSVSGFLSLLGPTTFKGGSYTGAGRINQFDNVVVEADTTIDVATYDWDGNYTTTIDPGVTFRINSATIDNDTGENDFGGTLNINSGALSVNTDDPWAMRGTMNLTNTGGGDPTVSGMAMIVRDSVALGEGINVTGGVAEINRPITFESTAKVNVDTGATLILDGLTTYQSGDYTGGGILQQEENANVTANTIINVATYDMDGSVSPSSRVITIDPGVIFTINSQSVEAHGDGFDGTLNINNSATLKVNTTGPWDIEGTVNMATSASIYGSRMVLWPSALLDCTGYTHVHAPVTVGGTIAILPSLVLYGDTMFESTAVMNLDSGDYINLSGPMTTYRGGTFTGVGAMRQNGDAVIEDDTIIGVATFDWDGGYENSVTTVNPGVTLTLNVNNIEWTVSSDGYDGTVNINSGATLEVNTPGAWMLDGQMNLTDGQVTGSDIINDGTISGYGSITPNLTNNGMASFNGGASSVHGTVSNYGNIEVTNYTTTFHGNVENSVTGTIKNTNGRIVFNNSFINNGRYESDPADNYFNNVEVGTNGYFVGGAGDRFFVNGNFISHSTTNTSWETSAAELTFNGAATNYFYLTGVDLGLDPAGYTDNFAWGTLSLNWGQWLVLHDGNGTLGGAVYVEELLLDAGTRIKLNGLNIYYRNGGNLKQFFCGDATLDGYVDGNDLDILLADWGTGVPPANYRADLSGDFFVDGDDLDIILSDWGKGVPPPVPEPASAVLLLSGGVMVMLRRRKK